jgi:hypothetical protein
VCVRVEGSSCMLLRLYDLRAESNTKHHSQHTFSRVSTITSHHITSHHIRSHHIISRHITSGHVTSRHITSHQVTSHHITSHHITSHHVTSHHVTSHHITSHHITSYHITSHHITSCFDSECTLCFLQHFISSMDLASDVLKHCLPCTLSPLPPSSLALCPPNAWTHVRTTRSRPITYCPHST